jgi:hypothetical protein
MQVVFHENPHHPYEGAQIAEFVFNHGCWNLLQEDRNHLIQIHMQQYTHKSLHGDGEREVMAATECGIN